jgi:eukaryotic-like serine/threonine-protein kinase
MTPQHWQQVDQLFHDALDQAPGQRAEFLAQSCAGDKLLRNEVESLIASYEQAENFIEQSASDVAAELLATGHGMLQVGDNIGHYRITSSLGAGGMGEVYLAQDTQLQRQTALKLLPRHFTVDEERVRRFEQEARAASALNHPNIVTIYEIGRSNSSHFIATEFVDGETLRQRMKISRLPLQEALEIATQVASALAVAHSAGIVHRDIKPENIMLRRDGFVKLLDFGIAKLSLQPSMNLDTNTRPLSMVNTNPGRIMGTAPYVSPEQARAEEVDGRTDVWSLGVVLYEMITGRVPFVGETPSHVIVSILESEPPPLNTVRQVPEGLEEIIFRMLRKNPAERYRTVSEFAVDLKKLRTGFELQKLLKHSRSGENNKTLDNTNREPLHQSVTRTGETSKTDTSSAEDIFDGIKRHKRSAAIAIATILLLTTLAYIFFLNRKDTHLAVSRGPIDSLAVLPFINQTEDSKNEHIAYGLSDSVINSLSRLPKLRVISLNAVLRYKGKVIDAQTVGRDLDVRAVLMSRMSLRGEDLSISTELVDVRDNSRIWGDQYNGKVSDILKTKEDIARKIAQGLQLQLSEREAKQLQKRDTQIPEAYALYTLGMYRSEERTKDGLEQSIKYFEEAIKLDPHYARAYVGLSRSYWDLQGRGFAVPKDASRNIVASAMKAVELDESLSEAHVALCMVKDSNLDWTGGLRECRRALELDPNSFEANFRYAHQLAISGQTDEALVYAKRADDLDHTRLKGARLGFIYLLIRQYDAAIEQFLKAVQNWPDNAQLHFMLGEALVAKGLYKDGIAQLQKAVALDGAPERWDRYPALAFAYAVSGQRAETVKILAQQQRLAKERYISPYNFAIMYTGLGDKDRAFEYLNKALDEGRHLPHVSTRPMFDSLRSDPRYHTLLRRIGQST